MSTQPAPNTKHTVRVTENVAKILRDKDRIIKLQAKRIELLERDVDKLRKERDSLSTKVTLLSYKLQVNGAANCISSDNASESCKKAGSRARAGVADLKQRSASLSAPPTPVARVRKSPSVCGGHVPTGTNSLKLQRQRSYKRNEEEEKVRKSRGWANAYELSQDLHDKQLELLQRKYGGQLRTRRAACIIQHAYRQHCMNKNFQKLCSEVGENRLSRRFSEFGRSKTIFSDMLVTIENSMGGMNGGGEFHSERYIGGGHPSGEMGSGGQGIHVRTTSSQSAVKTAVRVMQKSYSLNLTSHEHAHHSKDQRRPLHRSAGVDLTAIDESDRSRTRSPMTSPRPAKWTHEPNNVHKVYTDMNDSSASDGSPIPHEPVVDLPSVNFEQLLESKETDIINDGLHSDKTGLRGSQAGGLSTTYTCSHSRTPSNDYSYPIFSPGGTPSPCETTYEDFRTPFPNGLGKNVEIRVEDMCEDYLANSSHNGDMSDDDTLTRIYSNTEVHLRKRRELAEADADTNGVSSGTGKKQSPEASPIWKRKSMGSATGSEDMKRMSNISETSEPDSVDGLLRSGSQDRLSSSASSSDTTSLSSEMSTYNRNVPTMSVSSSRRGHHSSGSSVSSVPSVPPKVTDRQRKRAYRIGLNLFNKKPEKGIKYLIEKRFIDDRPRTVAKFLITRKGLSKQIIGEYLGNLQKEFNSKVLECFANEIDLSGLQVDMALRLFQTYFRMPGEAQKIERLMEAYATRYVECNPEQAKKFHSPSSIFLLAFAIIMLNTDLHNKNIKAERRMKLSDFIKNLRGLDNGEDMDPDLLTGIYTRIQASEFKPGTDHVTQVMKVEQMIVGKCPPLALAHRRLVCYCRLYEVHDPNKREKLGLHQREVFLFNDILMVTKILSKKKGIISYSFRQSFPLCGVHVYLFETPHYQFGIRLTTNIDNKILITFNARNEHDRCKFVEDIKEAIIEMNEMETLRISEELHRQTMSQHSFNRHSKDSGVIDIDVLTPGDTTINRLSAPECRGLKKNTLSNSLIDLSEGGMRRGSGGSLDSGMASTSSGSNGSREIPTNGKQPAGKAPGGERGEGGNTSRFNLFGKKTKTSKTSLAGVPSSMSEV